jgi:hypothetical protein
MRANFEEDSEKTPLKDANASGAEAGINKTNQTGDLNDSEIRKKKTIRYAIIGGVVLVVVILAIVLPIVLMNKDVPLPPGPTPPVPSGDNPYSVDETTFVND